MTWIAILLAAATLPLGAQWLNHPDSRTPRTKDGKPNLTAAAPRINGQPDLSGVWQAQRTPRSEFARVLGNDPSGVQVDLNDVTKEYLDVFWGLKPGAQPLRGSGSDYETARRPDGTHGSLPAGRPAWRHIHIRF